MPQAHDIDRFAAFAAWRAEQKGGTIPFPAFGSDWDVPARMPARLWLWIVEMKAAGRGPDTMSEEDGLELLRTALPPEILAGWRKLPIDIEEMMTATQRLVEQYMAGEPPGEPVAVEPTTVPPPSPSSNIGDLSRQTSPASTGSNLPPPWSP